MSYFGPSNQAYWAWIKAYGLEGRPGPQPTVPMLIGGPGNGVAFEPRSAPVDHCTYHRLNRPGPHPMADSEVESVLYRFQKIQLCWDAQPIRIAVPSGSGLDAPSIAALWREFTV